MSTNRIRPEEGSSHAKRKDTEEQETDRYGFRRYLELAPDLPEEAPLSEAIAEVLEARRKREIPDEWRDNEWRDVGR